MTADLLNTGTATAENFMTDQFNFIEQSTSNIQLTMTSVLLTLGVALLAGLIISLTYVFTAKKASRSQSFALTLIMVPMVLAMIVMFVGSNLARGLSLAGALAIIRFRSAPADFKDIAFVFFTVAAGLACGIGAYVYGILFVVVVCAILFVLFALKFLSADANQKILKILLPENYDYSHLFDEVFEKYTDAVTLRRTKTTDMGSLYELLYDVRMKKDVSEKEFIDAIRTLNGNLNIVLVTAESYEMTVK